MQKDVNIFTGITAVPGQFLQETLFYKYYVEHIKYIFLKSGKYISPIVNKRFIYQYIFL